MESLKKSLTVQPVDWSPAALMALEACRSPKADASDGLVSILEICNAGQLYALHDGNRPIAWYVVQLEEHDHGTEATVLAAAGRAPGIDLTRAIYAAGLHQFAACDYLKIVTRRQAMVRKLAQLGFGLSGFVMRKRIKWNG
jgi:hypothetical protein